MLRLIFLLLLSANLLFLAWQAWMSPEREPDLVLVSPGERQLQLADADARVPPSARHAEWRPGGCLGLGPFEARNAVERLAAGLGLGNPQIREWPTTEVVAWWVMIPSEWVADTEAMRTRLEERGAGDYFIIGSGEDEGGVSLGLFTAAERAERRQERIRALGFNPTIRERTDTVLRYWLILPLGLPLPESLPEGTRLRPVICPEAPESLVTREAERLE